MSPCDCGSIGPAMHYRTCQSLRDYPLEAMRENPTCPKCLGTVIHARYHDASWHYKPHWHDYWRQDLFVWECALRASYRPVEHIDRRCDKCGFAWLERTADVVTPPQWSSTGRDEEAR